MSHSEYWDRHQALLHVSQANVKQMQQTVLQTRELVTVAKMARRTCRENIRVVRYHRSVDESDPVARDMPTSGFRVMPVPGAKQLSENMPDKTLIRLSMGLIKEVLDMLRDIITSNDKEAFFELQKKIRTSARAICRRSSTIH